MLKKIISLSVILSLSFSSELQAMVPLLIAGVSGLGACVCGYKSLPKNETIRRPDGGIRMTNAPMPERAFGQVKTTFFPNGNVEEAEFSPGERFAWFGGFLCFSAITLIMILDGNKILKSLKLKR